jgi:hypothetical protein
MGLDYCSISELLSYFALGQAGVFPKNCVAGVTPNTCACASCLMQRGIAPTPETECDAAVRAAHEFAELCALVHQFVMGKPANDELLFDPKNRRGAVKHGVL